MQDNCITCIAIELEEVDERNSDFNGIFSLDDLYFIRDSVLNKYTVGDDYTTYYYGLSVEFIDDINVTNASSIINLGNNIIPKLKNFERESYSDTILITNNEANQANLLIQSFKSKTENTEVIQVLNKIETDINTFKGKTIFEIKDILD